jgi:anhydro-N-acetylmuramic acid kinase
VKIAGMLSGTSLDAIDVAICDVRFAGGRLEARCESFAAMPFDDGLRGRILSAFPPAPVGALEISALHAAIGEAFGDALAVAAPGAVLDAVASHGITLAHDGDAHHTLQLGDAFRIRERAGVTVVYDFRSADTAAGGQGAPLVPFVDALLFAELGQCVAVNLGGIANVTLLPEGIAFDAGPANLPIDTYLQFRTGGVQRCDRDGLLARSGTVDAALLAALLDDSYFRRLPPKSTGRERYGAPFIARWRDALDARGLSDAVATLTALGACSLAGAIRAHASDATLAIVSGGGARNPALVDALRAQLPGVRVAISDEFGIDPDAKEALAFAVLGAMTLHDRAAGLPRVTGARGPRLLGAIAPQGLEALLERLRREARSGAPPGPEKHAR